jgi:hypothetical protein
MTETRSPNFSAILANFWLGYFTNKGDFDHFRQIIGQI